MTPRTMEQYAFEADLRTDLSRGLPTLKKGVNILAESQIGHNELSNDVLRGSVAFEASTILSYQLRQKGYEACAYENKWLASGLQYPTSKHAVTIVTSHVDSRSFIVDAAYCQFLKPFNLDKQIRNLPEVVLFPADEPRNFVSRFVSMRDKKAKSYRDTIKLKQEQPIFNLGHKELMDHYANIWDMSKYSPAQNRLEDDLEKFKSDPDAVSKSIKKLIQKLGLVATQ